MNIAWFNWKDIRHPEAGGAEIVTHDILRRLVMDGHDVLLVTARYPRSSEQDVIDGVRVQRLGNRFSHYLHAGRFFVSQVATSADLVVEEVNTVPYFLNYLPGARNVVLFYPQLAREIWFYQMAFPASLVGYFCEPLYTRLVGRRAQRTVTISEDSKNDLVRHGFRAHTIQIMTLGIETPPLAALDPTKKQKRFTVLFHSSLRAMKRPVAVLTAFARLCRTHDAELWISGGGDQKELRALAQRTGCSDKVIFFGRTTTEQKLDLMQRATVLCSTSVKEGWGLVVTEANSMGTPAIVYDVDGLRSASRAGGNLTVAANPDALAAGLSGVCKMFEEERASYDEWCARVHESTFRFSFATAYREFTASVGLSRRQDVDDVR